MSYTGTPRTWSVGDLETAALFNSEIRDAITGIAASVWNSYVPLLTAASVNPNLGVGPTQQGQYIQIGKTVIGDAFIQWGSSGTATGTGNYFISLPVPAAAPSPVTAFIFGAADLTAAGLATRADLFYNSSTTCTMRYLSAAVNGTRNVASSALPGAWTAGDVIRAHFCYQAA